MVQSRSFSLVSVVRLAKFLRMRDFMSLIVRESVDLSAMAALTMSCVGMALLLVTQEEEERCGVETARGFSTETT